MRHLRPGDRVAVIAPAGPAAPERTALVPALFARFGLEAVLLPSCHAHHPVHDFLAGEDALRLADLHAAFADDSLRAVFCLRGGYGCTRLLERVDAELLRQHSKPFIGYSDITALHVLLLQGARSSGGGAASFHAPMPGSDLVLEGAEDDAKALFELLMNPLPAGHVLAPALLPGAWHASGSSVGVAEGRLVGGNLSLIAALCGTPWQLDTRGAILFLEDVSESLYRVDRLLTQLRQAGQLQDVAGLLLGSFTEDDDPTAVLREHLAGLGRPLLAGWPAGHGQPNRALPLGARVVLDARARTLTMADTVLR
jgi:muramoyltetrapeptide carboxypeptidase